MPVEIRVPPLGESLVDAVVGQWLKSEGDTVTRGETIVELETDKVNLDVTAPEDGVLEQDRSRRRRCRHGRRFARYRGRRRSYRGQWRGPRKRLG